MNPRPEKSRRGRALRRLKKLLMPTLMHDGPRYEAPRIKGGAHRNNPFGAGARECARRIRQGKTLNSEND